MTLEEILALLPDNTTGDIDAADLRTVVTELWNKPADGGGGPDARAEWFAGRQWYALGTSLVEQNFWTSRLATLSDMTLHNLGASSGTLANGGPAGGNGYIWAKLPLVGADAEVVTMDSSNDWRLDVVLGTVDDPEAGGETVSFYGALKAALKYLLTNRPAARLYLMTNYTDNYPNTFPNFYGKNAHGKWYWEYNDAVRRVCDIYGVPVIEVARESALNYFTAAYYTADGLHLNDLGGQRYAEYMWGQMKQIGGWETSPPVPPTGGTVVHPTSVTITQGATLNMKPGDTQQLSVTVAPSNATDKSVTWSTSNAAIATVSGAGDVTAVANGSATITVTTVDGGKTDTIAVTVSSTVAVTSVDLTPPTVSVPVGELHSWPRRCFPRTPPTRRSPTPRPTRRRPPCPRPDWSPGSRSAPPPSPSPPLPVPRPTPRR